MPHTGSNPIPSTSESGELRNRVAAGRSRAAKAFNDTAIVPKFPFAEAKDAYPHFESRGHFGKVVITH